MNYLHELTFETKEQAEKAARNLNNVERLSITDVSDDVAYFVDVPSAFDLTFHTPYPLDLVEQGVILLNSTGLILEMPPAFNLDAEQE
jgi:hypothetical protein